MVHYVRDYERYERLLLNSVVQVSNEEFFRVLAPSTNSIAILVNHIAGNFTSRFSNLLTQDGEQSRDRESEFDVSELSRDVIMKRWEDAWTICHDCISDLSKDNLSKTIILRGVALPVEAALSRFLSHFSYHVGEIVFISRYFRTTDWEYLSIAPGKSEEFNRDYKERHNS